MGGLLYLTTPRLDIIFAVSHVSEFMHKPYNVQVARKIFKYLKSSSNLGLYFKIGTNPSLQGLVDSDFVVDEENCSSTTDYLFNLGSVTFA